MSNSAYISIFYKIYRVLLVLYHLLASKLIKVKSALTLIAFAISNSTEKKPTMSHALKTTPATTMSRKLLPEEQTIIRTFEAHAERCNNGCRQPYLQADAAELWAADPEPDMSPSDEQKRGLCPQGKLPATKVANLHFKIRGSNEIYQQQSNSTGGEVLIDFPWKYYRTVMLLQAIRDFGDSIILSVPEPDVQRNKIGESSTGSQSTSINNKRGDLFSTQETEQRRRLTAEAENAVREEHQAKLAELQTRAEEAITRQAKEEKGKYIRISLEHIEIGTLKYYDLPWEYDQVFLDTLGPNIISLTCVIERPKIHHNLARNRQARNRNPL
jgi:hypothetical protein